MSGESKDDAANQLSDAGYSAIIAQYKNYLTPGGAKPSRLRSWWNGYFYYGKYHTEQYYLFIKLIDRLALIDSKGKYIDQLASLASYNISPLMDKIYDIFNDINTCYNTAIQENLTEKDLAEQQLKAIKKDIHHFATEQGQRLRIKKTNKTNVEDKSEDKPVEYQPRYELVFGDSNSKEKESNRKTKQNIKTFAWLIALIVGFGEGLVAVAALLAFPMIPFWFSLLVVGTSGWYCNFILFKGDIYDKVKELLFGKFFVNEKNETISAAKKGLIFLFGLLTLATGFVYGALSFLSVQGIFAASLGIVAASALAALPAIATCIGMTSIYFSVISNFIKNEQWKKVGLYFYNTYINPPWDKLSAFWTVAYYPFELTKLAFGLGLNAVVTIASFGLFHQSGLDLLKKFTASLSISNPLATGAGIANGFVSTPFNVANVQKLLISNNNEVAPPQPENPLQTMSSSTRFIKKCLFAFCASTNGLAQGVLFSEASDTFSTGLTIAAGSVTSAFPNCDANNKSEAADAIYGAPDDNNAALPSPARLA